MQARKVGTATPSMVMATVHSGPDASQLAALQRPTFLVGMISMSTVDTSFRLVGYYTKNCSIPYRRERGCGFVGGCRYSGRATNQERREHAMLRIDGSAVPRDRWGRPVIDGTTYVRASTLADSLDNKEALLSWTGRQTALGLATSPDLIAAVATTKPDDKKALDRLVEQAAERAKSRAGATMGTAIHTATELLDAGESIEVLPKDVQADAHAYRALLDGAGLTPLAAEVFVVNEELQVAGTFDRLLQGPHRVLIEDTKTSSNPNTAEYKALSWAIQIAVYANGRPWLPDRGIVDWEDVGLPAPSVTHGLVVHVVQGEAVAKAYSIDLVAGLEAARIAREVYDLRRLAKQKDTPLCKQVLG